MAAKSSQQNNVYFEAINPYRMGDAALLGAFLDGHYAAESASVFGFSIPIYQNI